MLIDRFLPDEYYESSYIIPYKRLYGEGYRGLIYDIDNTLVPHGKPADERSIRLFRELKEIGFKILLLSNNGQSRVELFNKDVNVLTIHKAGKPRKSGYEQALEMLGTSREKTLFIGDQIFTDIYGARRAGIRALMVKYIDPREEIQIVLKRILEKPILKYYQKNNKMIRNTGEIIR